jgi:hypothetical protein
MRREKKEKQKKKTEKKRRRRRGGKKNNNLFSFELGFQINNLVELRFLKRFYMMCLIYIKKIIKKTEVRILVDIII